MFVLFSPLSKVDKWMLGFLQSKNGWAYGQWYFSNRKWKWSHSVMSNSLRPMNCSPPSSSIHGILQARILECAAISFSRGSSWPRDRTQVSHIAGKRFNHRQWDILSVQFSHSVVSNSLWHHGLQHAKLPCPSPTPRAYSNSCHWVSDAIQPSHPLLSPSPSTFNFPQHQCLFNWDRSFHQMAKILEFVSTSVLPMNVQDWFPLGWTDWISLQSKGLSRVFSNTTVQKHQFFGTQPSSQSNSHP